MLVRFLSFIGGFERDESVQKTTSQGTALILALEDGTGDNRIWALVQSTGKGPNKVSV